MRRPSKRHVVAQAQDAYACCPRDEISGQTASSGRSTQSYATLRGRKWVDKQRGAAGCASGKKTSCIPHSFLKSCVTINFSPVRPHKKLGLLMVQILPTSVN